MIKKLKIKLILNNMFLVGIVVAIISSALCLLTYVLEEIRITNTLENNIDFFASDSPAVPENPQDNTDRIYNVLCTVLTDKNNQIFAVSGTPIPDENMQTAIDFALKSETERGNISSLNLSFLKEESRGGTLISFISREHLISRIKESIVQALIGAFISMQIGRASCRERV